MTKDCLEVRLRKAKNSSVYFEEVFEHIKKKIELCFLEEHRNFLDDLYTGVITFILQLTLNYKKTMALC